MYVQPEIRLGISLIYIPRISSCPLQAQLLWQKPCPGSEEAMKMGVQAKFLQLPHLQT